MNKPSPSDLFDRYFDGDLSEVELETLRSQLLSDPKSLTEFCNQAGFEAQIIQEASSLDQFKANETISTRSAWATSLAVAAIVTLFLGLALWWVAIPAPESLASYEVSPQGVVEISGANDDEDTPGALDVGSTLRVSQGRARIKLRNGVVSIIQAPASLKLLADDRVSLSGGIASFTVPPAASGFKVITDSLEVTDLGTVFGIDDTRGQQSEVHVLKGVVEAKIRNIGKSISRVHEGEAFGINALGQLSRIPVDHKRFPSDLGQGLPAARFSFDHFDQKTTNAEGSLAYRYRVHLALNENAPQIVPGRFGKALSFSGDHKFAQSNWFGISGRSPRSISLWFRIDQEGLPNPLLCWGLKDGDERMSNLGLRLSKSGRARLVSGHRWLEGRSKLDDGEWHHLVVVISDFYQGAWPKTQMFIDGVREPLTARVPQGQSPAPLMTYFTVIDDPGSLPLTFGSFSSSAEDALANKGWNLHGDLDEVVLVEGVLDEDQIQALFRGDWPSTGLDLEKK